MYVYSLISPLSPAEFTIYTSGIGTLSYTDLLWWVFIVCTLCCSYSQSLQLSYFVPPGTHHHRMIWEVCQDICIWLGAWQTLVSNRWSPIQVLTLLTVAKFQWSDGNWCHSAIYYHGGIVCRLSTFKCLCALYSFTQLVYEDFFLLIKISWSRDAASHTS